MPTADAGLTRSTGKALRWNYLGIVVKMVLAFGVNALLSRLLGPGPFGELGIAMIVFGFGNLLCNVGLTSALVQKKTLNEFDIRFCFTCQVLIALAMTLIVFLTAGFWGHFFKDPHLKPVLRVFSTLFVLQALGTTSGALLSRKQDVRSTQTATILSYVIAYLGIGVPMAFLGAGVWSLIAAWLSQALLNSVLLYLRAPYPLWPRLHSEHLPLLTFGARILGANVCSWAIMNMDNTFVGRVSGPVQLGYYGRTFTLLGPVDNILMSLLQVLLPAFSRVHADTEKLRNIYASIFGFMVLVVLPPLAAIAATANVVLAGLYGRRWLPSAPFLTPIALAMAFHSVLGIAGPLLAARGRPHRELAAQLATVCIAVAAYLTALHWSILDLSWTVLGVYIVRFVLLTTSVNREIGTCWRDLGATALPGLGLAAISASAAHWIAVSVHVNSDALHLIAVTGGSALTVVATLVIAGRYFTRPMFSLSPQLRMLVPARLQFLTT